MVQSSTHRSLDNRLDSIQWKGKSPLSLDIETRQGDIKTRHGRFVGGAADQVEVIEVDTGVVRVYLLPTRGMSIWCIESEGIRYGWQSPVSGPVHPSRVPIFDPSGKVSTSWSFAVAWRATARHSMTKIASWFTHFTGGLEIWPLIHFRSNTTKLQGVWKSSARFASRVCFSKT
jgi:hypothetical protein